MNNLTHVKNFRCPITFVNDESKMDDSVNYTFLTPYEMNLVSHINRAKIEDDKRRRMFNASEINEKDIIQQGMQFAVREAGAVMDHIMSYLVTNITDLAQTFIYRFVQNAFTTNPNNVARYSRFISNNSIRQCVIDILIDNNEMMFRTDESYDNLNDTYVRYDAVMESIFAILSAKVFDKLVVEIVQDHFNDGTIVDLYREIYRGCFESEDGIDDRINDPSYMYTFTTSCIRDVLWNSALVDFRMNLSLVAASAAQMWYEKSKYCMPDNYMNPEYNSEIMIKKSSLSNLSHLMEKMSLLEDKDASNDE